MRYAHPRTLHEALNLAIAVDEDERRKGVMKLSIRGQTNLQASYLGQQISTFAKETILRNQVTRGEQSAD